MILMLLLWIALWRWRSWEFLGYFALTLAILQGGLGFLANLSTPELAGLPWYVVLLATLIDAAIYVGIFSAVGAAIVMIRGGKREQKVSEAEIDAELARVRAQVAERDNTK